MGRRVLAVVALVLVVVAIVMVAFAWRSEAGVNGAMGVWGFVLAVVSVGLGAVGLWPSKEMASRSGDTQNVTAENGDAFGVQKGSQTVIKNPRAGKGESK